MFKRQDQKWDQNAAVVVKILQNSQGRGVQFQALVNLPDFSPLTFLFGF